MEKGRSNHGSEGVQVEWIGREVGKILRARDHNQLAQNVDQLRERVHQLDEVTDELERLGAGMLGQGMDPASLSE